MLVLHVCCFYVLFPEQGSLNFRMHNRKNGARMNASNFFLKKSLTKHFLRTGLCAEKQKKGIKVYCPEM